MKYLITGGAGFIGQNLVEELSKERGIDLLCWDEDLCKGIDIKNDFDVIYHLAAIADTRFPDDVEMFRNNILSSLQTLRFSLSGHSKLIYASSTAVYPGYKKTAYAKSKEVVDEIMSFFWPDHEIVGLRISNVFGPHEDQKGERKASMITQWADQIKAGKNPMIFEEEEPPVTRDHIYVKDVIKALKMAEKKENGIYDVGSGESITFISVLETLQKVLGTKLKPIYEPNPFIDTYQKYSRAELNWGFKPDYSLEEGIRDYLK